jgi:hypothetical protein
MSVKDIKLAITRLPSTELAELADWFEEFHAQAWDEQIEKDVEAGRFDQLVQQMLKSPTTSLNSSTESFPFLPE